MSMWRLYKAKVTFDKLMIPEQFEDENLIKIDASLSLSIWLWIDITIHYLVFAFLLVSFIIWIYSLTPKKYRANECTIVESDEGV